jgi:hypothetical protein
VQARAAILIFPRSLYHYHLYISAQRAFLNREVERGHNLLAFDEQDHVREVGAMVRVSIFHPIDGPPGERCCQVINSSHIVPDLPVR